MGGGGVLPVVLGHGAWICFSCAYLSFLRIYSGHLNIGSSSKPIIDGVETRGAGTVAHQRNLAGAGHGERDIEWLLDRGFENRTARNGGTISHRMIPGILEGHGHLRDERAARRVRTRPSAAGEVIPQVYWMQCKIFGSLVVEITNLV